MDIIAIVAYQTVSIIVQTLDSNSKHKDRRSIVDVIVALLAIAAAAAAATTTTTTGSQFLNSLVGVSPYHSIVSYLS